MPTATAFFGVTSFPFFISPTFSSGILLLGVSWTFVTEVLPLAERVRESKPKVLHIILITNLKITTIIKNFRTIILSVVKGIWETVVTFLFDNQTLDAASRLERFASESWSFVFVESLEKLSLTYKKRRGIRYRNTRRWLGWKIYFSTSNRVDGFRLNTWWRSGADFELLWLVESGLLRHRIGWFQELLSLDVTLERQK